MVMKSNKFWSLYLVDVSNLNFIPVYVVICTHLRYLVITFLNSLKFFSVVLLIVFYGFFGI